MNHSNWVRAAVAVSGLVWLGASGLGCKKEKDSLIVVSIIADAMAGDVNNLTLSAGGTTKVFALQKGLGLAGQIFGLYVSSDAIGDITVNATASRPNSCLGYKGQGNANLAAAGDTSDTTTIRLSRAVICSGDGGVTTGTGGSLGTGGAGGTGTGGTTGLGGSGTGGSLGTGGSNCASTPAAGTPPPLTCCTEYSQEEGACATDTYVDAVAFSPDGTLVATGGDDATVRIWSFDGRTLTLAHTLSLPVDAYNYAYGFLSFSPDGQYFAAGGVGAVLVFDVAGFTQVSPPLAITNPALGVAFAPDSRHVVSVDMDTVYVHVIGTPTAVATASLADLVGTLAVSPVPGPGGSTTIVVGGATTLYDAEAEIFTFSGTTLTGPVLLDLTSSSYDAIYSSSFTADGSSLALGDYVSNVWLTGVPSATTTLTTPSLTVDSAMYSDVRALAFSPARANYLAVATGVTQSGQYGLVSIWDVGSKTAYARYSTLSATPQSIAFSPSGNAIVLGEQSCHILLCTN